MLGVGEHGVRSRPGVPSVDHFDVRSGDRTASRTRATTAGPNPSSPIRTLPRPRTRSSAGHQSALHLGDLVSLDVERVDRAGEARIERVDRAEDLERLLRRRRSGLPTSDAS